MDALLYDCLTGKGIAGNGGRALGVGGVRSYPSAYHQSSWICRRTGFPIQDVLAKCFYLIIVLASLIEEVSIG
jgi:hypothetical protein